MSLVSMKQASNAGLASFGVLRRDRSCIVRCSVRDSAAVEVKSANRRQMLGQSLALCAAATVLVSNSGPSRAVSMPDTTEPPKSICDAECAASLESKELTTLPSGLQYRDIVEGKGISPPVGYQVVVNYVAMTPKGRIFDSSIEKGKPYDIRVGAGQVIPGLDEGLLTMKTGGVRRLYIPGSLAFPKGLKAAAGRPSVPPGAPVMFDVELLYIPGLEVDE